MVTTNEKKFMLKLDKAKKILFAEVAGSFGPDDANDFVQDYTAILNTIKASEYELLFNCENLKVSGKDVKSGVDMTNMLKGCIEMYKKDGFKKVMYDCKKNIIVKMQISRLSREVGLPNFEVK
jgi:hypothetical protein